MSGDEDIEEQMKKFTFPPMPPGISMPPPPPPVFTDNLIDETLDSIDQSLLDVADVLGTEIIQEKNSDLLKENNTKIKKLEKLFRKSL